MQCFARHDIVTTTASIRTLLFNAYVHRQTCKQQSQCEIVLLIIKALMQDLSNEFASDLSSSRRNDIITGLEKSLLPKIFQFILQLFEQCYAAYIQEKRQGNV